MVLGKNWLHYHWVYLVIAAVVLWVGISWLANALHWGETLPDYQIAYVGKTPCRRIPPAPLKAPLRSTARI